MNLPEMIRIRSEIATAISELAHIVELTGVPPTDATKGE